MCQADLARRSGGVSEAERCGRPERKAQINVAKIPAHGGANDETEAKDGADQTEGFGALFRLRHISDVGKCRGHVRGGDSGNKAADEKPAQGRRECHKNVVDAQSEARNEDHGTAAKTIRPPAKYR
jgi:hypothetical protein